MRNRKILSALMLVSCASVSIAGDSSEITGYGFDWLNPDKAVCQKISSKRFAKAGACTKDSTGFGAHTPVLKCTAGDSEWMIYATEKQCKEELETMEANAP